MYLIYVQRGRLRWRKRLKNLFEINTKAFLLERATISSRSCQKVTLIFDAQRMVLSHTKIYKLFRRTSNEKSTFLRVKNTHFNTLKKIFLQ